MEASKRTEMAEEVFRIGEKGRETKQWSLMQREQ